MSNPQDELETQETEQVENAEVQQDEQEIAGEEVNIADLIAENAKLQEELSAAKDQALRAAAEAQNARRRAEQDVEKAHKFGQEKIVADLLPVIDNIERALAAIDKDNEANKGIIEGLELTYKSFIDILTKHKIEQVDPAGEPFDPQLHQAMTQVPNPDVEPNTVIECFQKGYTLHGRLVRPAMVVVSQ